MTNENNLPELPQGWVWTDVGSISNVIHYGYTASAKNDPLGLKCCELLTFKTIPWIGTLYHIAK